MENALNIPCSQSVCVEHMNSKEWGCSESDSLHSKGWEGVAFRKPKTQEKKV